MFYNNNSNKLKQQITNHLNRLNPEMVINEFKNIFNLDKLKEEVLNSIAIQTTLQEEQIVGSQVSLDLKQYDFHEARTSETATRIRGASLIDQQRKELKALEFEMTRVEIENKKRLKENQIVEPKPRELKSFDRVEPDKDDVGSVLIVFRLPDSDKLIERRFLFSDLVGVLYDFIDSIPEKLEFESLEYCLISPFPFRRYDNREKTIEEENIGNAILQIHLE